MGLCYVLFYSFNDPFQIFGKRKEFVSLRPDVNGNFQAESLSVVLFHNTLVELFGLLNIILLN